MINMRKPLNAWCCAGLTIACLSLAWVLRARRMGAAVGHSPFQGSAPSPAPGVQPAFVHVAERASLSVKDALAPALWSNALHYKESESVATPAWSSEQERSDYPLFPYLATRLGGWDANSLVRHVDLNIHDRPFPPVLVQELADIVACLNQSLKTLADAYAAVQTEEMIAVIEAGGVPPEEVTRHKTSVLRALAKEGLVNGEMPGLTLDEAVAKLEERLVSMPSNGMFHKGKVYRASRFTELPKTDAAFEVIRVVVFEAVAGLGSWFLVHGYTTPDRIDAVLREGNALTRYALDDRGPQRRAR
jgi:hypothetical protein